MLRRADLIKYPIIIRSASIFRAERRPGPPDHSAAPFLCVGIAMLDLSLNPRNSRTRGTLGDDANHLHNPPYCGSVSRFTVSCLSLSCVSRHGPSIILKLVPTSAPHRRRYDPTLAFTRFCCAISNVKPSWRLSHHLASRD